MSSLKRIVGRTLLPSSGDSRWPAIRLHEINTRNISIQTHKKLVYSLFCTYSRDFRQDDSQDENTDRHSDRPVRHDFRASVSTCDCFDDNRLQLFYTVLMDLKFARTIINICVRKLPVNEDLQTQIFFSIQALHRLIITSLLLS
jgi:hypothetical protein